MKKIFKIAIVSIVLILVILIVVPFIFKDKIITLVKAEANKSLNADVNFTDIDLSLIRSFPNLSVNIARVSIVNRAPFKGDTLYYAKDTKLTLDIMSVIKGNEIKINKVVVEHPVVNLLVNKDGKANWDIAPSDTVANPNTDTNGGFKAALKYYALNNAHIVYRDVTMPFSLELQGLNHSGSGDFTSDFVTLNTQSNVASVTLNFDGIAYLYKVKTSIDALLELDLKNFVFTFKENKILLNQMPLAFSGWVSMPKDDIDMDLKFSTPQSDFKNFISLIPGVFAPNFDQVKASGTLGLDGFVKGRFNDKSMPGFGLGLKITNGNFKYPDLPSSVNNVMVDLKINNEDGIPDHTIVKLSKFHAEIASSPLDARLYLKNPISDPYVDLFLKGKVDLSNVQKFIPLEKGVSITGRINADLEAKGTMSAASQQNLDRLMAKGNFEITNFKYIDPAQVAATAIHAMSLTFDLNKADLKTFDATLGNSDIKANGSLQNIIGYALTDALLTGNVNLSSNKLDLNQWMQSSGSTAATDTDTSTLTVPSVPSNLNINMTAKIGQLFYDNLIINNLSGGISISDQSIILQKTAMYLMDGSMVMDGGYSSKSALPTGKFNLDIKNFDIQKTASAFNTVEKLAPIAKHTKGKFSSLLAINTTFDKNMAPLMNSINGSGKLTTSTITVSNFEVLNKLSDALKMSNLKTMQVAPVNPSFNIVDGRVFVAPFDAQLGDIKATIGGSTGLDQSLDYVINMNIPRAKFGGAANATLNSMVAKANNSGANFSLGEVVPVAATVKGTIQNPVVGTDLSKQGGAAIEALKAKATEEFDKKKQELEQKGREEAEKLKAQAKVEAEKIKNEASQRAKAIQDSIKKAAEQKAKDAFKDLNPFKKK
ncbi:MAG: hypothetical protein RIQ89_51 [Bacteroidota bacterium]|jgi:hypothetical protein